MVFTSWAFVVFFLVVLAAIAAAPKRSTRQLVILVASVYFYSFWDYRFILLLATPSIIDYLCAIRISEAVDAVVRKRWLILSLVTNLGLLAYFKYTNFFFDNLVAITGLPLHRLAITLPVGISFFTFKTLSYTIDVYRGHLEPCRSLWRYAMFITYFPELIAGPIVRASVFLPQMTRSLRPSFHRMAIGSQVILLGVTKKLLIADRLAILPDAVFQQPAMYSQATVISAVVAYSLQIYCDFSGYSDIAIGVSRIIGFDLPENFNMPYASISITEFWRRWHMTLSQWLRDYLYIPLGGNRLGSLRTYLHLMATMLLGGLWHGASWNFVIWGGLHGVALSIHKMWSLRGRKLPVLVAWVLTYSFVCFAWIFFRAQSLGDAVVIVSKILGLAPGGVEWMYSPLFLLLPLVVLAHFFGLTAARLGEEAPTLRHVRPPKAIATLFAGNGGRLAVKPHTAAGLYCLLPLPGFVGGVTISIWAIALYLFSALNASPFIYFQF